jgi:hypothetical protein
MNCEICEMREAACHRLCECCVEGITRLLNIELPEYGIYFAAVEIRCHECHLVCHNAGQYLNHACEPMPSRSQRYVGSRNRNSR